MRARGIYTTHKTWLADGWLSSDSKITYFWQDSQLHMVCSMKPIPAATWPHTLIARTLRVAHHHSGITNTHTTLANTQKHTHMSPRKCKHRLTAFHASSSANTTLEAPWSSRRSARYVTRAFRPTHTNAIRIQHSISHQDRTPLAFYRHTINTYTTPH